MVGAEMMGRLGNQMFRYAYARAVIERRGCRDALMIGFHEMRGKNAAEGWCDSLQHFRTLPYTSTDRRLFTVIGSPWQRALSLVYAVCRRGEEKMFKRRVEQVERKWLPLLGRAGLLYMNGNDYVFDIPLKKKTVITRGFFEDPKYFNDIRHILLDEFTPRYPEREHNKELYDVIRTTQSVCVSVRRGDYVSNAAIAKDFNVCGKDYFDRAIRIMRERLDDPVFILFSDDVEWAKDNIRTGCTTYHERGDDPVWEKLRLMYSCKHFIISNSTFSWWAQYLGREERKIVVAPDRWFAGGQPSHLLLDSFVKVPTVEH